MTEALDRSTLLLQEKACSAIAEVATSLFFRVQQCSCVVCPTETLSTGDAVDLLVFTFLLDAPTFLDKGIHRLPKHLSNPVSISYCYCAITIIADQVVSPSWARLIAIVCPLGALYWVSVVIGQCLDYLIYTSVYNKETPWHIEILLVNLQHISLVGSWNTKSFSWW